MGPARVEPPGDDTLTSALNAPFPFSIANFPSGPHRPATIMPVPHSPSLQPYPNHPHQALLFSRRCAEVTSARWRRTVRNLE